MFLNAPLSLIPHLKTTHTIVESCKKYNICPLSVKCWKVDWEVSLCAVKVASASLACAAVCRCSLAFERRPPRAAPPTSPDWSHCYWSCQPSAWKVFCSQSRLRLQPAEQQHQQEVFVPSCLLFASFESTKTSHSRIHVIAHFFWKMIICTNKMEYPLRTQCQRVQNQVRWSRLWAKLAGVRLS